MKVIIFGISGKMGSSLAEEIKKDNEIKLLGGVSRGVTILENDDIPDVIIDFSHYSCLKEILNYAIKNNAALVLGTTGYNEADFKMIKESSLEIPIIYSANYSLGVFAIIKSLKEYIKTLKDFDINIIEKHSKLKIDKPSGTALKFIEEINKYKNIDVSVYSIRSGNIAGEHRIIFNAEDEMIEITHTITSRRVFVLGAIKAAKFISKKEKGLYTMDDLLGGDINGDNRYYKHY